MGSRISFFPLINFDIFIFVIFNIVTEFDKEHSPNIRE